MSHPEILDPTRRRFVLAGLGSIALGLMAAMPALAWIKPTEPNVLGPYHRKGAPFRTQLAAANEPGERLIIRGRVLDTDGRPLKGAVVDVWQADAKGRYDNDDAAHPPDPSTYKLRGQMKTDAQGRYEYETIVPGNYGDPGEVRPKHIHYIVSQPGYVPLTTQLYFKGDRYLANDPFVRKSLIIALQRQAPTARQAKGTAVGTFDIVLARPAN